MHSPGCTSQGGPTQQTLNNARNYRWAWPAGSHRHWNVDQTGTPCCTAQQREKVLGGLGTEGRRASQRTRDPRDQGGSSAELWEQHWWLRQGWPRPAPRRVSPVWRTATGKFAGSHRAEAPEANYRWRLGLAIDLSHIHVTVFHTDTAGSSSQETPVQRVSMVTTWTAPHHQIQ